MRKKLLLFVLMTIFALNYGNIAAAQDNKTTNKKKTTLSNKIEADNSHLISFNIDTEKLPPNYKGTDIVKLFSILLKKAPLNKEEFETTADHENKIIAAIPDEVYALKLSDNGRMHGLRIQPYNADTQELQIDIETDSLSKHSFDDYRSMIIIKSIAGSSKSYIGSNAFGAKVKVMSYSGKQYGIALVNQEEFGKGAYGANHYNIKTPLESIRTINIAIVMPIDKAKKLKNNIGVLLLCKPKLYRSDEEMEDSTKNPNKPAKAKRIKSPFEKGNGLIFEDQYYAEATFDSPASISYDRKFINVEVLAIWVYDIRSGEIIFKKELQGI